MKKLENFTNSLSILAEADFKLAEENDIYRTGIIGQFNLTFELAWKALQEIMRLHSVEGAATGSPREILQLGYKIGFINDSEVWLLMLKKRNTSVHIYNEDEIDEMIMLLPCFRHLLPSRSLLSGCEPDSPQVKNHFPRTMDSLHLPRPHEHRH